MTLTPPYSLTMSSGATSPSKNISYEKPEQPPGRTATRRASDSSPSASRSVFTLVAADAVSAIVVDFRLKPILVPTVVGASCTLMTGCSSRWFGFRISVAQCYLARGAVGQAVELVDGQPAELGREALDEPF